MKALAHKLARAAYYMMREGKPFDLNRCFGLTLVGFDEPGGTVGLKPAS